MARKLIIFITGVLLFSSSCTEEQQINYLTVDSYGLELNENSSYAQTIEINLFYQTTQDIILNIEIGGSATPNEDYLSIPNSVVIPAGYASIQLPIRTIDDNIFEGNETIILNFTLAEESKSIVNFEDTSVFISIEEDDKLITLDWETSEGTKGSVSLGLILHRIYNESIFYVLKYSNSGEINLGGGFENGYYGVATIVNELGDYSGNVTYTLSLRNREGISEYSGIFENIKIDDGQIIIIFEKAGETITIL